MAEVVVVEVAERVATITLNRPEARNALSREVRRRLFASLEALEADDDVDVVILTGADPAFCAGLDLKELAGGQATPPGSGDGSGVGSGGDDEGIADIGFTGRGPFPPMATPVIGAINGVAITGGLEIALACDFLVASERAAFADTHGRVGIQPGWGLTVGLAASVGVRRAKEMSATGNFVDAQTALTWGLVNHVVAHDDLLPTCRALAAAIVGADREAVRRVLQTYDESALVTGAEAWALEARVGIEWLRAKGGAPSDVDERRRATTDRGRGQVGER